MRLVAIRDPDELLVEEMLAPPPLEEARTSLEFWRQRRKLLPFYLRGERREADEMIRRWRARVEAAERARFGTGLFGAFRRLLVLEPLSWPFGPKWALFAIVWRILPRRLALLVVAAFGVSLVVMVGIVLGLAALALHMA